MNRNEFNHMFDLSLYEKMRIKYNAKEHFHHLYNKTSGCQSYNWESMLAEEEGERKKKL
jgi:hypothetical protein